MAQVAVSGPGPPPWLRASTAAVRCTLLHGEGNAVGASVAVVPEFGPWVRLRERECGARPADHCMNHSRSPAGWQVSQQTKEFVRPSFPSICCTQPKI